MAMLASIRIKGMVDRAETAFNSFVIDNSMM
jgi:hypothetical protein